MADTLTRNDVLSILRDLLDLGVPSPERDAATYGLLTDRIAALALVLRELPAEPAPQVVEAPVVEPAPVQGPACPYPPVLTRWGLATWRRWSDNREVWLLDVEGSKSHIVTVFPHYVHVYSGRDGVRHCAGFNNTGNPMPAILAALRELGSLPDEAPHAP